MKRWASLVSLLGVLAVGAGTAAAQGTATASIHLKAPSSIAVGKPFRVTASGHSPTNKGSQYVLVTFTRHATCASTAFLSENRGDFVVPFKNANSNGFVKVSKGSYSVTSKRVQGNARIKGLLCGYLYAGSQTIGSKPEAHTSRAIKFTRPFGPVSKASAGKVLN